MKAFINWSGGKDAALALHRCRGMKHLQVGCLFTNKVTASNRVSMHGVRWELVEAQAASIGLPLYQAELPSEPGSVVYEEEVSRQVKGLKELGYTTSVFGDIYLEDLKVYRQAQMSQLGMDCLFPLWREAPQAIIEEFLGLGFKAIVVCVDSSRLHPSFCGRLIDIDFINDLPADVDVCGENGEFHSFVFDGPIFKRPVRFQKGDQTIGSYAAPQSRHALGTQLPKRIDFVYTDLLPGE
ncbi:MAG TPA: diphthine--ammonia ligase [Flavisolibacter sp.]|nr:diphthine--ammonia ligase [Flavisolibacter sp.]